MRLAEAKPVRVESPEHREGLILELAGDLLYRKISDPEWIRNEFGRRFGAANPGVHSDQSVDLSRAADGVVLVTFTLRSVHDWDRLRRAGYLAEDRFAGLRGIFRDRAGKREHWREPETSIRAVAIHYLSRSGGGTRTLVSAADRYAETLPASGGEWEPGKHAKIIHQIEDEYGPLP
jgi:hypothetical protein